MDMFYAKAAAFLGAAIAMGLGSIGPAIGQGMIGAKACESVAKSPEHGGKIRLTMIIAMSFVETCAIYAFLTVILLLLYSK